MQCSKCMIQEVHHTRSEELGTLLQSPNHTSLPLFQIHLLYNFFSVFTFLLTKWAFLTNLQQTEKTKLETKSLNKTKGQKKGYDIVSLLYVHLQYQKSQNKTLSFEVSPYHTVDCLAYNLGLRMF